MRDLFIMNKEETISNAIAHLNGYKVMCEKKFKIPSLAVDDTIKKLKELLK